MHFNTRYLSPHFGRIYTPGKLSLRFDLVKSSSRSMGQGLFQGNGELRKVRDNSRQCTSDTLVTAQLESAGHIGPARPDAAAQSVAAVQAFAKYTTRKRPAWFSKD